jgi:hypothetical protein
VAWYKALGRSNKHFQQEKLTWQLDQAMILLRPNVATSYLRTNLDPTACYDLRSRPTATAEITHTIGVMAIHLSVLSTTVNTAVLAARYSAAASSVLRIALLRSSAKTSTGSPPPCATSFAYFAHSACFSRRPTVLHARILSLTKPSVAKDAAKANQKMEEPKAAAPKIG